MGQVVLDISMSLDGYIAGPNQTLDKPLGEGGERLHEWVFDLEVFRRSHGMDGGVTNADTSIVEESFANRGATVMGRRMFSGGAGPWADDPNASAWWGDDPPFHHPVFVVTHHAREPLTKEGGTTFTFVTEGVEAALDRARAAAGEADVAVGGGGSVVQQFIAAGLLDELQVHVVPVLLGDGVRLFDGKLSRVPVELKCTRTAESPSGVSHLRYEFAANRVVPGTGASATTAYVPGAGVASAGR
jgi:dihydrofolate reductase